MCCVSPRGTDVLTLNVSVFGTFTGTVPAWEELEPSHPLPGKTLSLRLKLPFSQNSTFAPVTCWSPRSGALRTQKLRSCPLTTQSYERFCPLKSGVGQNVACARNNTTLIPLPTSLHIFQIFSRLPSPRFALCTSGFLHLLLAFGSVKAVPRVDPAHRHPASCHPACRHLNCHPALLVVALLVVTLLCLSPCLNCHPACRHLAYCHPAWTNTRLRLDEQNRHGWLWL